MRVCERGKREERVQRVVRTEKLGSNEHLLGVTCSPSE